MAIRRSAFFNFAKKSGGIAKPLPHWIAPQLATLSTHTPAASDWLHENKFDGYRLIIKVKDGKVRLYTRNHKDWSDKFKSVVEAVHTLGLKSAYLDSELTVLDKTGRTNFQNLQKAIKFSEQSKFVVFIFDCMYLEGLDLRNLPLIKRKEILEEVFRVNKSKVLRYSEHVQGHGDKIFKRACHDKLEGIISKHRDAKYQSSRSLSWLKSKCSGNEEFLIIGFTPHSKLKNSVGALLLGSRRASAKEIVYCGKVGTGFSDQDRKELFGQLTKLVQKKSPLQKTALVASESQSWVKPKLIAQIQFTERTSDGLLRHPSFLGLRNDKPAEEVHQEPVLSKIK